MEKPVEHETIFDTRPIECCVCHETLVDPRALPCGHSYCGPEKDCLEAVKVKKEGLKCIVCREKCNLDVNQLKPLYGIRDYLKQVQPSSSSFGEGGNRNEFLRKAFCCTPRWKNYGNFSFKKRAQR